MSVSCSLFGEIIRQYQCWQNGIPPGREWRGRGGQNPRLLACFERLGAIDGEANR